jgi:hypothetical protein
VTLVNGILITLVAVIPSVQKYFGRSSPVAK